MQHWGKRKRLFDCSSIAHGLSYILLKSVHQSSLVSNKPSVVSLFAFMSTVSDSNTMCEISLFNCLLVKMLMHSNIVSYTVELHLGKIFTEGLSFIKI